MSASRSFLFRPLVLFVFTGLALAGVTTFWGQNPAPQNARQTGAAGTTQSQSQSANPNAAASTQPSTTAQPTGQQAGQTDRQTTRNDRANSADSRQSRTNRDEEQEDAGWLGIYLSQRDNDRGATIAHVYPAGPAARAGLQPNDVIQQINGQQVSTGNDLIGVLEKLHPGDKAELNVLRNNEPTKITAKLGSRNSFVSSNRQMNRFGGQGGQYDSNEDQFNFPLHAMDLENDRRNAEQHQRIETEIAQLRDEIRQLRETLQRR